MPSNEPLEEMTRDRYIVLLTKHLAGAYVVATIGKGLIFAALEIWRMN